MIFLNSCKINVDKNLLSKTSLNNLRITMERRGFHYSNATNYIRLENYYSNIINRSERNIISTCIIFIWKM